MTHFLLANVNRLVLVTLRTVGAEPPVYIMRSAAAYARRIRFLPPLFLAMNPQGDRIAFCKFDSDFLLFFQS